MPKTKLKKHIFILPLGRIRVLKNCISGGAKMLENILSGISLQPENIPNWLVVVMGMGTVFIGLICIIIICKIVSLFFVNKADEPVAAATPAAPAATVNTVIENRQEIIAAVTAVIAEEMGTDVNALRVISFKKI